MKCKYFGYTLGDTTSKQEHWNWKVSKYSQNRNEAK